MFRRHDPTRRGPAPRTPFGWPHVCLAAAAALGVLVVIAAMPPTARAATIEGASASPPAANAGQAAAPAPRYHLRCWQNGRLLFEQSVATLPADAGRSTRLQAKDGASEPVIVYETRNATCLARGLRVAR
jgi:hypothetical protein